MEKSSQPTDPFLCALFLILPAIVCAAAILCILIRIEIAFSLIISKLSSIYYRHLNFYPLELYLYFLLYAICHRPCAHGLENLLKMMIT